MRHALLDVGSTDVLRFLGRRMPKHGGLNGNFLGEVMSDVKTRPEGTRALLQAQQASPAKLRQLAA